MLIFAIIIVAIRFGPTFWYKKIPDVIVQSESLDDLYGFIKPNEYNESTFVIFDIDNTLARTPDHYGSDQWFYWKKDQFEKEGFTEKEAIDLIMPELLQISAYLPLVPVEKNTAKIVKNLQDKGVTVIALSARSLDLTYRTIEQLHEIGIHFKGKGPHNCLIQYGKGKPALYIDGIIFSGNHTKGEVIAHWFDQIDYHPKKVIFIDDKMKNLSSVEQALHKRNYPFIGIRYGYLDDYIKTITPEKIEQERTEFQHKFPESRPITAMPAHS